MSDTGPNSVPAITDTKFKPGNPGRRKGSKNKRTLLWATIAGTMEDAAPEIAAKLIEMAKAGNVKALDLYLAREMPAARSRKLTGFRLPDITTSEGLSMAYQAVSEALTRGVIDPDEAVKITALLDGQRKNLEDSDTQKRLKVLEAHLHEGGHE